MKYNRWQQRNGPTVQDVTSVKYNKEKGNFLTLVNMLSNIK